MSLSFSVYLMFSTKSRLRSEQERSASDAAAMRQEIAKLRNEVEQLCAEADERAATPPVVAPGFNMHKASEALRMCRRGCDDHTIAAALGMTRAELALIRKAHSAGPAAPIAFPTYSERAAQASSSRAVYSAEA
jgi:hypothetical protein